MASVEGVAEGGTQLGMADGLGSKEGDARPTVATPSRQRRHQTDARVPDHHDARPMSATLENSKLPDNTKITFEQPLELVHYGSDQTRSAFGAVWLRVESTADQPISSALNINNTINS